MTNNCRGQVREIECKEILFKIKSLGSIQIKVEGFPHLVALNSHLDLLKFKMCIPGIKMAPSIYIHQAISS